jgi:hypothetical protein
MPSIEAWDAADRAARAAARGIGPTTHSGSVCLQAAYASTAVVDTRDAATLAAVAGNAPRANAFATEDNRAVRIVEVTRHAISSWRRLAELDDPGHIDRTSVDSALDAQGSDQKPRQPNPGVPEGRTHTL